MQPHTVIFNPSRLQAVVAAWDHLEKAEAQREQKGHQEYQEVPTTLEGQGDRQCEAETCSRGKQSIGNDGQQQGGSVSVELGFQQQNHQQNHQQSHQQNYQQKHQQNHQQNQKFTYKTNRTRSSKPTTVSKR